MCATREDGAPDRPDGAAVRPMVGADVRAAARLHARHLPHGFFPRMGPGFLAEYYRTFISSPHATAWVIGDPGEVDGLLVGVLAPGTHSRWVMRERGLHLALAGTRAMLVRPWLLWDFASTRLGRYWRAVRSLRSNRTSSASAPPDPPVAILSHVVVDPTARRKRAGSVLVTAFAEEAQAAGITRLRATTLAGPEGACGFYERTGWFRASTASNWDAEQIVVFELPLTQDSAAAS